MNNWELIEEIILCPDCKSGKLSISRKDIKCLSCGANYPIVEDIPVLIKKPHQKTIIDQWDEIGEFEEYDLEVTPRVKEFVEKHSRYGLNLDCGCGAGAYTGYFKQPVVSMDLFPYFIKQTAKASKNRQNAFIVADAKNPPFKNKSFSLTFCSSVLEHFTQEQSDDLIKALIKLSNNHIMVDVPNNGNSAIKLMRYLFEIIFTEKVKRRHKELEHHRIFSPDDLKKHGFKVYGCLGWVSYKKIKYSLITKMTDAFMRMFPSFAGTIIGIRSN